MWCLHDDGGVARSANGRDRFGGQELAGADHDEVISEESQFGDEVA